MIQYMTLRDIYKVRPALKDWFEECNKDTFGINITVDDTYKNLRNLIEEDDAVVLGLFDGDEMIGFMGIVIFTSPFGNQRIANEHCWYVRPKNRCGGSLKMIKQATKWAKEQGCSHLIMNASKLAGDLHKRTCQLYKVMGFDLFETSYIRRL